jgi:hypothetical protein
MAECNCVTASGNRCSRTATKGKYCWQHAKCKTKYNHKIRSSSPNTNKKKSSKNGSDTNCSNKYPFITYQKAKNLAIPHSEYKFQVITYEKEKIYVNKLLNSLRPSILLPNKKSQKTFKYSKFVQKGELLPEIFIRPSKMYKLKYKTVTNKNKTVEDGLSEKRITDRLYRLRSSGAINEFYF